MLLEQGGLVVDLHVRTCQLVAEVPDFRLHGETGWVLWKSY